MIRDIVPSADNYYEATAYRGASHAPLQGEIYTDVCVIGGGIAGCSTALHLAQRGYRVVLLEAQRIGHGASGRSGGQLLPGYSCGQSLLQHQLGTSLARQLWDISVAGVQLTTQLINQHAIECDLRYGHLDVAIKLRHRKELLRHQGELEQTYDYRSLRIIERDELRTLINSPRYCAALYDAASAHVHPLNYTLGLARAAVAAGAILYERSAVLAINCNNIVRVQTSYGVVNAQFAVLCGNVDNAMLINMHQARIMPVSTCMLATAPLGEERARSLITNNAAVSDCNFILDYFRLSADTRLLFGGGVSYSGRTGTRSLRQARQHMLKVFPQLANVDIDYQWNGLLDISMKRAPDFGRLQNNIYYLQGFSGHGMALAGIAGKLVADSIATQSEYFDLFARIQHHQFPGGRHLRTPLLMMAMLWYRLRDII